MGDAIFEIIGFVPVVIFFIIFFAIAKNAAKVSKASKQTFKTANNIINQVAAQAIPKQVNEQPRHVTPEKGAGMAYSSQAVGKRQRVPVRSAQQSAKSTHTYSVAVADDKSNDWLANQLREEYRVLKNGTLGDIGAMHDASCAADNLKKEHAKNHNRINRLTGD